MPKEKYNRHKESLSYISENKKKVISDFKDRENMKR